MECVKPIAILIAGDPVPLAKERRGGFEAMIRRRVGDFSTLRVGEWIDVDIRTAVELPKPEAVSGVIVTGSASSVTDREPWTLRGEELLRQLVAAQVPVLGICYGHQMLGQALGGLVEKNPRGREIGTVQVEQVESDPILGALSLGEGRRYPIHATHVDSVTMLPPGARVLATTKLDPNAAVRFGEHTWGVQFHPEFDPEVMRAYIETRRDRLHEENLDPDRLLNEVRETPTGPEILQRFIRYVYQHPQS
jgi:GMP synthase (glutamine-hydrolysing)